MWKSQLQKLYAKQQGAACSFLVQTAFDAETTAEYGAPAVVWSRVDVASSNISVEVLMLNKTTTRRSESILVQFLPAPTGAATGDWSVDKLGEWLNISDVVEGGAKHLHGNMEGGIRVDMAGHRMSIAAQDAAIASFGNLTAYPYPIQPQPDTADFGASFVVYDNLWGVNYVKPVMLSRFVALFVSLIHKVPFQILWFPFNATAPEAFASSGEYFPTPWNSHLLSRFTITFGQSG